MKKQIIVWVCLLISLISSFLYSDNKPKVSDREYILTLLKTYSPEGYEIVSSYDTKAPAYSRTDFMNYVDTIDDKEITSTINTVVHEICHGYTGLFGDIMAKKQGTRGICYYFYINKADTQLVSLTETFPSKRMKGRFPKELQTFRFSYIDTTQTTLSTQSHGIYGLLDELNAYTQGTKTAYSLHPYFMTEAKKDQVGYFFADINGTLYGILEFRFFILNYLMYAQKHEKKIYRGIINNNTFKTAFQKINLEAGAFISEYLDKRTDFYAKLKRYGMTIRETEDFLYIGEERFTATGYSNFFDVYTLLNREMETAPYQSLMKELGVTGEGLHYPAIQLYEDTSSPDESDPGFSRDDSFLYEDAGATTNSGVKSSHPLYPVTPGKGNMVTRFRDQKDTVFVKWADITSCTVELTKDFFYFTMNLADLPTHPVINHSSLSPYVLEYQWSFEIDVNNDDDIELICSVSHVKEKGKKQAAVLINEAMEQAVYRARPKTLEFLRVPYVVNFHEKKIVFRLERGSHPLITEMEDGFQISFSAYFYNGKEYAVDALEE